MALKTYISCLIICCCLWYNSIAQSLLFPRMDSLILQYNNAIYKTQFTEAQTLLYHFLSQQDLSFSERLYGEYLQICIYQSTGSPEIALERLSKLEQQLSNLPETQQPAFKALFLGKIAECHFDRHSYDTAYVYALRSIKTQPDHSNYMFRNHRADSIHLGNPLRDNGHAINYIIVGAYEKHRKNYQLAQKYYDNAIQIYKANGNLCEMPLVYIKLAHLKLHQGQQEASLANLKKALTISDSCDIQQYRFLTRASLTHYYKQIGAFEKAIDEYEKFNQISNQIYQDEQRVHINELQIKYQTELAHAENDRLRQAAKLKEQDARHKVIVLLGVIGVLLLVLIFAILISQLHQAKNQKLEEQVQQIKHQKQERDALLKEVHHRVKNNLQIITSLLHLESTKQNPILIGGTGNGLFQSSQDRINALALVHELLYQSETIATIPLENYLRNLIDSLLRSHGALNHNIQLSIDLPPVQLNLDTATPLGLLFNEILTNSLAHGFQDVAQKQLYIRGQQITHNQYVFYIGDNGIGCSLTVDFDAPQTLGFNLMQRLARQLGGTIEQINPSNEGCHYKLTIQLG